LKPKEDAAIVMENMVGGSLSSVIEGKKLDATKMNEVIISMVKCLFYLHSNRILPRDIKPSNVLFACISQGFAKIGSSVQPVRWVRRAWAWR
jgi:serine/threonine protein kinase